LKIPGLISYNDWDIILDSINELPDAKPVIDMESLYKNSLARYRMPGLYGTKKCDTIET